MDKDDGFTDYLVSVLVNNVAPVVGEITAPVDPINVNTIVNASAPFTDTGILDIHSGVWDWGDYVWGGVYRSVFLESTAGAWMDNVWVRTEATRRLAHVECAVRGPKRTGEPLRVRCQISAVGEPGRHLAHGAGSLGRQLCYPPWLWGLLLCLTFTAMHAIYWSSTEYDATSVWFRILDYGIGGIYRDNSNVTKTQGLTVRCVMD